MFKTIFEYRCYKFFQRESPLNGIDANNLPKEKLSKQEQYIHQNRAKHYTKTLNFLLVSFSALIAKIT